MRDDLLLSFMVFKEMQDLLSGLRQMREVSIFAENLRGAAYGSSGITQAEIDKYRLWNQNWASLSWRLKAFYSKNCAEYSTAICLRLILNGQTNWITDSMKSDVLRTYQRQNGCACPDHLFPITKSKKEQ